MHSSWLFPGATSGSKRHGEPASGDRLATGNSPNFEINSYVRKLNLHGICLPGSFPSREAFDANARRLNDLYAGKSLNELLNVLNDSVDRVVDADGPRTGSKASSFGSFRSGVDDNDPPSVLNDLINLVSATADELEHINAGNEKSDGYHRRRNDRYSSNPKNDPRPEIRGTPRQRTNARDDPVTASATKCTSGSGVRKRKNSKTIDFDAPPMSDDFFDTEISKFHSSNKNCRIKDRKNVDETPKNRRYLDKPTYFLPEVIRLAKSARLPDSSTINDDGNSCGWISQSRRINFNDELWPIGAANVNNGRGFPPYFAPSTGYRLRPSEKNFADVTERTMMNASRSSPIFGGAGEAPAEPLDIVVPTRDRESSSHRSSKNPDISTGNARSPSFPPTMSSIDPENNLFDVAPTKLNQPIEAAKTFATTVDKNVSSSMTKKPEAAVASDANDDRSKRKACVRVLTKRHRRPSKQMKICGRRKIVNRTNEEDEREEELGLTLESPTTTAGPVGGFFEESVEAAASDEEKFIGPVRGEDDTLETQMEICTERQSRDFQKNRLNSKLSKTVIVEKNKFPVRCGVSTEPRETRVATSDRSSLIDADRPVAISKKSRNVKNVDGKIVNNNSAQPIWKPAGCTRLLPSTSSSSVTRRSKIAQSTPRLRPNTSEAPNKFKDNAMTSSGSRVSFLRKNPSQDVIAERCRSESSTGKRETSAKRARSRSKQRPGTPKKIATTERGFSDVKTTPLDENSRKPNPRKLMENLSKITGSNVKTTIPVVRSKTFVYQTNRQSTLRSAASKEDHSTNSKSATAKSPLNSSTSGLSTNIGSRKSARARTVPSKETNARSDANDKNTVIDSRFNAEAEKSRSDFQLIANSNRGDINASKFSSNDSIAVEKMGSGVSPTGPKSSSALDGSTELKNTEEKMEKPVERISRMKYHDKHVRSLRMLKSILSHHGVSVEGVNEDAVNVRPKIITDPATRTKIPSACAKKSATDRTNVKFAATSKTLFEKLAVLTENLSDRNETEKKNCGEKSVGSIVESTSESATSWETSMRDAEEQCCLHCGSSVVSRTSLRSKNSFESEKFEKLTKRVSNVSTEIDEDYRRTIYVDAAVIGEIEENKKRFEVAETQTRVKVMDEVTGTEEIVEPTTERFDVCTETPLTGSASKESNTDFKKPENIDAASQIDGAGNSTTTATGNDDSGVRLSSRDASTDRPDLFLKSRGVCVRGPRKIDGASQFDRSEKSKDTASGSDYADGARSVSEDVNTDRQDYLFEDRSVNALAPTTDEQATQIDPVPLQIVDVAVGEFTIDVQPPDRESFMKKGFPDVRKCETIVVKNADVVQWQSSTNFNGSRINGESSCSSASSLVAWRPKWSPVSSVENCRTSGNRVPKEAIVAFEMANERAQNFYRAIAIHREMATTEMGKERFAPADKSVVDDQSSNDERRNEKFTARSNIRGDFRRNSKIKSLLEANLERLRAPSPSPTTDTSSCARKKNTETELNEEVTIPTDDFDTNLDEAIKSESEYFVCGDIDEIYLKRENSLPREKRRSTVKFFEVTEEKIPNEKKLRTTRKNVKLHFFWRNSLLTVIYGTVCSIVFWALQFSIRCDSV